MPDTAVPSAEAAAPRAVSAGGCWSRPDQMLLLRAALLDGEAALEAWRRWREGADLDGVDPGSFRLLPVLWHDLSRLGVDDPILERCRGIFRHAWSKNHLLLHRVRPVLAALEDSGIRALVLKAGTMGAPILPQRRRPSHERPGRAGPGGARRPRPGPPGAGRLGTDPEAPACLSALHPRPGLPERGGGRDRPPLAGRRRVDQLASLCSRATLSRCTLASILPLASPLSARPKASDRPCSEPKCEPLKTPSLRANSL